MNRPRVDYIKLTPEEKQNKTEVTSEDCRACGHRCCRYISVQIDTPECLDDFSNILWMAGHRDSYIFVEDGLWYVEVRNECEHLDERVGCLHYEKRPKICREHGTDMSEDDICEGFQNVYDTYDHYFTSMDEVEAFIPGYLADLEKKKKKTLKEKVRGLFRRGE